jgi:hypothetical protein
MSHRVTVDVNVQSQQAVQKIGYLKTMMNQFAKEVTDRFVSIFSAVAVVKMGFDKVSEAMNHNMQIAKQISSLSTKFHIDPKEVHSLMMSAEQAGVSVRSLLMGMKNLGAAATKTTMNKEFAAAFKMMGMDAKNLGDMATKPAKHFGEVALQLSKIGSETLRATVGAKLLGRAYQQLEPLIEKLANDEEERSKLLNNPNALTNKQVEEAKVQQKNQAEMKEGFEHLVSSLMPVANLITSILGVLVTEIRMIAEMIRHYITGGDDSDKLISDPTLNGMKPYEKGKGYSATRAGFYGIENEAGAYGKEASQRTEREQKLLDERKEGHRGKVTDWSELDEFMFRGVKTKLQPKGWGDDTKRKMAELGLYTEQVNDGGVIRDADGFEKREAFKKALAGFAKDENGDFLVKENSEKFSDAATRASVKAFLERYNAGRKGKDGKIDDDAYKAMKALQEQREAGKDKEHKDNMDELYHELQRYDYMMRNAFATGSIRWKEVTGPDGKRMWRQVDENWRESTEVPEETEDLITKERQKKMDKKLSKQERIAERQKRLAGVGEFEGYREEKARINLDANEIEAELAKEKLEEKQGEIETLKDGLKKAQEDKDKAKEALVADPHNVKLLNEYKNALDQIVQKNQQIAASENEVRQAAIEVKNTEAKRLQILEQIRKAKDADYEQTLREKDRLSKDDEDDERRAFNNKMRDWKIQGKTQEEIAQATLDFEKKKLEEAVKAHDDAIREAELRKVEANASVEEQSKRREEEAAAQEEVDNAEFLQEFYRDEAYRQEDEANAEFDRISKENRAKKDANEAAEILGIDNPYSDEDIAESDAKLKEAFDARYAARLRAHDADLNLLPEQISNDEALAAAKKKLEEKTKLRKEGEESIEVAEVDKSNILKTEKGVKDQEQRVQDAIYGMAFQGNFQASEMRKIGGGGTVFGGVSGSDFGVVAANRKKIPLLQKIEENTRKGRNANGMYGIIEPDVDYGGDFKPTD